MTMGQYIKQLRLEKELSQDALGKLVGVNRAAVNKWENGSVENIKRSTIKKLSEVFGVSPCDLMKWDEEPGASKQPVEEIKVCDLFQKCHEQEVDSIVSMLLKLDSADRQLATGIIQQMLAQDKYSIQEGLKNA